MKSTLSQDKLFALSHLQQTPLSDLSRKKHILQKIFRKEEEHRIFQGGIFEDKQHLNFQSFSGEAFNESRLFPLAIYLVIRPHQQILRCFDCKLIAKLLLKAQKPVYLHIYLYRIQNHDLPLHEATFEAATPVWVDAS